ncbi:MAG: RDD family protein, partial [Pseudomonadota bacterium]
SLGARLAAQLADILVCGIGTLALVLTLAVLLDAPDTALITVGALLFLFIRAPYYVAAELAWAGRTLGKRAVGLRVISADGRSLSTHAVVLRNLMKEAEVFVPGTMLVALPAVDSVTALVTLTWIAIVLAIPLTSRRRQRLGDILAGTCVIDEPTALLLPDLAERPATRFAFQPHHLDHYGAYELQTLESVLRAAGRSGTIADHARRDTTLALIVGKIRARIDYPEAVAERDHQAFLGDFYAAQRLHLESRQLMGDARADKHHRSAGEAASGAARAHRPPDLAARAHRPPGVAARANRPPGVARTRGPDTPDTPEMPTTPAAAAGRGASADAETPSATAKEPRGGSTPGAGLGTTSVNGGDRRRDDR